MGDGLANLNAKMDQMLALCTGHTAQLSGIQTTLTSHGKKLEEHDKNIAELQQQFSSLASTDRAGATTSMAPGLKRLRTGGDSASVSTGTSGEESARATRRERTVVINGWPAKTARKEVQEFLRKHVASDVLVLSGFMYPTEAHLVFATDAAAKKFVMDHNSAASALQWPVEDGSTRRLYTKKKPSEQEQLVGYVARQWAAHLATRIDNEFEADKKKAHIWTEEKKLACFFNGEKLVFTKHFPADEPQLRERLAQIVREAQRG
mmetsp:Transcript_2100/g.4427  ORF Transcript_2100/g.4427 Transcript_2100/m.4427 type:complete len:263 (+) Transcript_2100:112-900(+)